MAEETKSQPVVSEGLDEKDLLGTWVLVSSRFTSAEEVAAFETPHRLVFTYGAFVYQPDKSTYACQEKEGKVVFVDPWEPEEPVKFVLQADGTLREDLDDGDYADYLHLTTAKPQHVSEKVGKFLGEWEQRETKFGNAKIQIKPGKGDHIIVKEGIMASFEEGGEDLQWYVCDFSDPEFPLHSMKVLDSGMEEVRLQADGTLAITQRDNDTWIYRRE